jgi:apoptosis-inducing factor 3
MNKENEKVVAHVGDLQDGEMKQIAVDGTHVLLVRVKGQYAAVGATCPHYGGPLVEGAVHGERVICPWHHACFNVTTGGLEEPPAMDALPRYMVRQDGDSILVTMPVESTPAQTEPGGTDEGERDTRVFVILGGGAAGHAAAETLRQEGFRGRIVLITREEQMPYDRPNLSKDYLAGTAEPGWLPLRDEAFYVEQAIEAWCGREVQHVDTAGRTLRCTDGGALSYDALLLATGGTPRTLDVPGVELENVFPLRSLEDANRIIAACRDAQRAVVVGASFIGMEVAASLTERGLAVTIVAPGAVPFEKTLGERIGRMFQELHMENGVTFRLKERVVRIEGQSKVAGVVLASGEHIAADLVVVGLGVKPATHYVHGITLQADGGVPVNACMQAADRVFAAGDIAWVPDQLTGEVRRIEHWRVAQQQGRAAAHAMLGHEVPYTGIPFFWTTQFGQRLNYVGYAPQWDELLFWGDPTSRDFLAFYVKRGKVVAAAGLKHDAELAALEELMRIEQMPVPATLRDQRIDLVELLQGT